MLDPSIQAEIALSCKLLLFHNICDAKVTESP
ncbi:MAG: Uncharacterised protein [Crocinitomicaceae bacterium]|nr:MAG: Uncharacterised protein [Crocinitomicaceae bacterium]